MLIKIIYRNKETLLTVFIAGASLTFGGFIYLLLRPQPAEFFNWLKFLGFNSLLQQLRYLQLFQYSIIPDWFIYSFPNFLWAFAYALTISRIWWHKKTVLKYFWLTTIPVLVFGYEFLQLTKIISGTFCFQDLFFGALGIGSGIVVGIITTKI